MKIAKFNKVSYEQFKKDWIDTFPVWNEESDEVYKDRVISDVYNNLILPVRATSGSAGYDFFAPCSITLKPNESIKIPTGIRCNMQDGWVLNIYPRSGHGFKYGTHLANTVGIIDADYFYANNEGHIFVKLVNDSSLAKEINIDAGVAFCQGIFLPFGITVDDNTNGIRHGGFGSTSK